jgi:intergrase/recombinase
MKPNSIKNYSRASKARWARFTPEERSEKMRAVALAKWSVVNEADRRVQAYKMLAGKYKKNVTDNKGIEGLDCECARDGEVR